jgi:hypothetical protein
MEWYSPVIGVEIGGTLGYDCCMLLNGQIKFRAIFFYNDEGLNPMLK